MNQDSIASQLKFLDEKLTESIEQKKREETFATKANQRFEKNIACFKNYYPEIARAIEQYKVRDGFCIHVTKTGFGNIVPYGYGAMLYSDDPIMQTKQQIKTALKKPFTTLTDYTNYQVPNDDRIHMRFMAKLSQAIKEFESENDNKIIELGDLFPSAVIFGIGLGYHLPLLLEKVQFQNVFVAEPDFELFFASLFCTDWAQLIEKLDENGSSLFLLLGADEKTFITDLEVIAERVGAFSLVRSFCYQHTPQLKTNQLIAEWINGYFLFQNGHGFFNDSITGFAHSIHMVEKGVSFLTSNQKSEMDLDTPVFIVGNGPSLDEAEDFLKANHKKAIVIAAGTAIASLHKKGIHADFHVLIERPYANYKIFGDIVPPEVYQKTNLLGVNTLYPDTVDRYRWAGIAVKGNESGTDFLQILSRSKIAQNLPMIPYCNPVVANTGLSFAMYLGFKNIYLFGVDNGKAVDGMHHSKDSIYKFDNDSKSEKGYCSAPISGKLLPGNFGGEVESNDIFASANHQLEKLVAHYPGRTIYNIGTGAKINGTLSTHPEELLPIDSNSDIRKQVELFKLNFTTLGIETVPKSALGLNVFDEIIEHLTMITKEPVSTRAEALDLLTRQERFLYTYQDSKFSHLFHVIKGAMLYYHCPMITMLFKYTNEQRSIEIFDKLNSLWQQYLHEMRLYFPNNYYEKCDLGK